MESAQDARVKGSIARDEGAREANRQWRSWAKEEQEKRIRENGIGGGMELLPQMQTGKHSAGGVEQRFSGSERRYGRSGCG